MKKNIKIVALIYIMVALLTYVLTLRIDRLESVSDTNKQNRSIVLKLK